MDSSGMLRALLCVGLLAVVCHGEQASQEVSAEDFGVDNKPNVAAEKELMEAMEALLGSMHDNRASFVDKRGSIPMCGIGERCAMKYGPRIGRLCDCGRGNCNSYLLKCI